MDRFEKLQILTDAAKYDVSCSSSGVERKGKKGMLGSAENFGICHSFTSDGRCVSLLKLLLTNYCIYDCKYCVNRCSNDVKRTALSPREVAQLTIDFYRRNYIEGLFLSSGVVKSPDYTVELFIKTLSILRYEYNFNGYIHVKTIPATNKDLIKQLGLLADRMSINIEMPSNESLVKLAPNKSKESILTPMGTISQMIQQNKHEITCYKNAKSISPAGQSTQMIIGATPDTDFTILNLTQNLYQKYKLKRVCFSAYVPVVESSFLPSIDTKPPLLREHRLYQADWLLRFYGFKANELLDEKNQNFNSLIDPKCNWALNHMDIFPMEINKASYESLLRVPGIGVKSAKRIVMARRTSRLDFTSLKKIGVVLKRAQYFITCNGKTADGLIINQDNTIRSLISDTALLLPTNQVEQLSLFNSEIQEAHIKQLVNHGLKI